MEPTNPKPGGGLLCMNGAVIWGVHNLIVRHNKLCWGIRALPYKDAFAEHPGNYGLRAAFNGSW